MARSAANIKSLETVSLGSKVPTCTEMGEATAETVAKRIIDTKNKYFFTPFDD
jgi:hypothetical protein